MTIEAGATLGPYEILSTLGAGGMGEVYRARDSRLDREVALKILPPEFAGDPERMRRFVREAKSASSLSHPNILTIHEIGVSGGFHHIATELVEGDTLRHRIARGRLPLGDCLEIASQVAGALEAAHAAGIVHRDIKPENVMIRSDRLVKVLDFGLAKWGGAPASDPEGETLAPAHTQPGIVMGTVAYMSPEQSRGRSVDGRTDLWSLGVVVYEMLTGSQPFEGDSSADVLANVLQREPERLTVRRPDVPDDLSAIVERCLAKDLSARYATAGELLSDLRRLKRRLEASGEPDGPSPPGGRSEAAAQSSSGIQVHRSGAGRAIAVLPFTNMSADPENEYFCDGLAEELLNALAKLEGLKVAARTSAFSFKGSDSSISQIGRSLGVTTVLQGSVRSSGNRSRIAVQLINAEDGYHLWSERFDVEMSDIFDVQDKITLAVVDALKVKLFGDEKAAALKRGTDDPEAYQLYLKGRYCWNRRTAQSVKEAVGYYTLAIARDPGYALAYAGLAESYVLFSWLSVATPRDSMPKAEAAALKALELDDGLAEAHAALGVYQCFFAWDQDASEKELRRAVELAPRSAPAHHWLGNTALLAMGRFDESIEALKRAAELDPLSPIIGSDTGVSLFYARRYEEAADQFLRTLALAPDFYVARYHLGLCRHAKGMIAEAVSEYEQCLASNDDPWVASLLARSLAAAGRREDALRHRDRLLAEAGRRYVPNVGVAVVHAALGEKEEALKWLEKDFAERSLYPPFYAYDPVFDDLRDCPGFGDLVRRVGVVSKGVGE